MYQFPWIFRGPEIRRFRMLQIQIRLVESSTEEIMDNYSMKWAVDRMVGTFVIFPLNQDDYYTRVKVDSLDPSIDWFISAMY